MDFSSNSVVAKSPNFLDLGLSPANTTDKLKSVIGPATRVEVLMDISDWLVSWHGFEEVTVGRVGEAKLFSDYIENNEFETMKVFERENISVTRPTQNISLTLENISMTQTTQNIQLTRPTEFEPLTRPTEISEENEKGHIPDDPDLDP